MQQIKATYLWLPYAVPATETMQLATCLASLNSFSKPCRWPSAMTFLGVHLGETFRAGDLILYLSTSTSD